MDRSTHGGRKRLVPPDEVDESPSGGRLRTQEQHLGFLWEGADGMARRASVGAATCSGPGAAPPFSLGAKLAFRPRRPSEWRCVGNPIQLAGQPAAVARLTRQREQTRAVY